MSNVIIHFGMPKTGSSSIQQSLARRLNNPRAYYLKLGSANGSMSIATAFQHDPTRFEVNRKMGTSRIELRRLRDEINKKISAELQYAHDQDATAILSAEIISSMQEEEFRNLAEFVFKHERAVTAVGYIRSPKGFMESAFQQRVKGGNKSFNVSNLFPPYRGSFAKLETVLGAEHVRFWHFDPGSFPGGCVVQDFCRRLGIEFRPEDVIRVNEGLSLPAVSLLYAYRKLGSDYGVGTTVIRENILLAQRLALLRGPKMRLHSSLVAPVIESRREDIAWMEARLGTSLSEDLAFNDEGAIRSEEDLLTFAPETLQWLAEQLGPDYVDQWRPDMTTQEVANWMHLLRLMLAGNDEWIQRKRRKVGPIAQGK